MGSVRGRRDNASVQNKDSYMPWVRGFTDPQAPSLRLCLLTLNLLLLSCKRELGGTMLRESMIFSSK